MHRLRLQVPASGRKVALRPSPVKAKGIQPAQEGPGNIGGGQAPSEGTRPRQEPQAARRSEKWNQVPQMRRPAGPRENPLRSLPGPPQGTVEGKRCQEESQSGATGTVFPMLQTAAKGRQSPLPTLCLQVERRWQTTARPKKGGRPAGQSQGGKSAEPGHSISRGAGGTDPESTGPQVPGVKGPRNLPGLQRSGSLRHGHVRNTRRQDAGVQEEVPGQEEC